MSNGRKRLFAGLCRFDVAGGFALPAAPAEALPPSYGSCQYDPYWRRWHEELCLRVRNPAPRPLEEAWGVCVYDEWSGTWVIYYVFGQEPCDPPV